MTSLALANHAAPAFNGLYYATAATIIPLLYVALFLQSTALQNRIAYWLSSSTSWFLKLCAYAALAGGGFMLTLSGFAEFGALHDLYRQRTVTGGEFILTVMAVLIAAVTVAAIIAFFSQTSEQPEASEEPGPSASAPAT